MSNNAAAAPRFEGATAPRARAALLASLVPALLDFEKKPGRYRLALREPEAIFEQTREVLLLAAGRSVEGLAPLTPGVEADSAQRAACFFVQTVLLRPGADHYTLLGLKPDFESAALRDHYRLMIRLTHPDFAASGKTWPADAATRINSAHDVLGSSVRRSLYDAAQGLAKPAKPMAAAVSPPQVAAGAKTLRRTVRRPKTGDAKHTSLRAKRSHRGKMALAAGGAMACALALWLMSPPGHDGSLVAHPTVTLEASKVQTANATAGNPEAKAGIAQRPQALADLTLDVEVGASASDNALERSAQAHSAARPRSILADEASPRIAEEMAATATASSESPAEPAAQEEGKP